MPGVYFPAITKAGGNCFGMPDVCQVPAPPAPPIPIPFPNIGMCMMADKAVDKVLIEYMPVVVENCEIPLSSGDEPGVAGGVVSGCNMGPNTFKMGSMKVKAKGKGVVTLTGMTSHNGKNPNFPAGLVIAPSQVKVLVSP
jgi:hypothetical protein